MLHAGWEGWKERLFCVRSAEEIWRDNPQGGQSGCEKCAPKVHMRDFTSRERKTFADDMEWLSN